MVTRVQNLSGLFSNTVALSEEKTASLDADVFWDGIGWHFYTLLKLSQDVERAGTITDSKLHMKILSEYIAVASQLLTDFEFARLLEVQGSVNHFYLSLGGDQEDLVKAFAERSTSYVEKYVEPVAGSNFRQFHQAADFGTSIILKIASPEEASSSFVSLGNCANAPAKQVGKSVIGVNRPLWLPTRPVTPGQKSRWIPIETKPEATSIKKAFSLNSDDPVQMIAESVSFRKVGPKFMVLNEKFANLSARTLGDDATPESPEIIEAFLCRADMDGFTAKVEEAFKGGEQKVIELVNEFRTVVDHVKRFKDNADGKGLAEDVIDLAWAGDCVNFVVLRQAGETYSEAATYLPLRISQCWHARLDERKNGGELPADTAWVFCPSGGKVFLADVMSGIRKFRVACGWPSGTSHDGVNCDGTLAGWTVLHNKNVIELSETKRKRFTMLNNDYQYATLSSIRAGMDEESAEKIKAAVSTVIVVGGQKKEIYPSKPFYPMPGVQ